MPLNAAGLKTEIKSGIEGEFDPQVADQLDKLCEAIANAVVAHIIANALVTGSSATGGAVTGTVS